MPLGIQETLTKRVANATRISIYEFPGRICYNEPVEYFVHFILYPAYAIIIAVAVAFAITHIVLLPSNDRDWSPDQTVMPSAEIKGNLVTVHNIRNFEYASITSYVPNYYDKAFDLNALKKVWYIVEPFSGVPGSAHTFLSFEFEGDQFLAISIEIRKEKGEAFHPIKGLFNQYEIMYVAADERDVLKLRTNYRKDLVYAYPIKAPIEKMKAVFLDMAEHMNTLRDKPEFYNTLTNTCTTKIVGHVNKISPKKVPFSLKVLFPANSDRLAYDLGLIDTDLSFEEAQKRFFITDKALKYANDPNFSVLIRQ